MDSKALEILVEGKALIDTPEKWTRGTYMRNAHGVPTSRARKDAVCFCSEGAIQQVTNFHHSDALYADAQEAMLFLDRAVNKVFPEFYYASIVCLNDSGMSNPGWPDGRHTTHEDIMRVWDRAIADAKAAANT